AELPYLAERAGKGRADPLQREAYPRADIDGGDQPLLGGRNRAAELSNARAALRGGTAGAGHALPQFINGRAGPLGRRLQRRYRAVQIDLLAGLLQLGEGIFAGFAQIGERLLDLVAALERNAL